MLIRGKESLEAIIYAAAGVDCEGSITLMRNVNKRGYHTSGIFVAVANVDKRFIDFYTENFGGHVLIEQPKKLSRQQIYRWKIYGHNAAEFLRLIKPYLKIKEDRANLAIWFDENKTSLSYKERDNIWLLMKDLNKGLPPAETKREEAGTNLLSDSPTL
jgi:hypothetical protein